MFTIALRNLQWRRRRIVIAVFGAGLVISLALVMSGLSAGFDNEAARTVGLARATGWVVDAGGTGPFLQPTPLPAASVAAIRTQVGIDHAAAIVFGRQSLHDGDGHAIDEQAHVNLVGVEPERLGSPHPSQGRGIAGPGEAVVDASIRQRIGATITLGSRTFRVVGRVSGARLLAGVPNVYVSLTDAREMTFAGQQLATAVVVDRPYAPIAGTRSLTNAEAVRDGLHPVDNAERTITMVRTLLWIVAGLIVGSVIYLGVLERTREVAVLKGMGARTASLVSSLAVEASVLALAAAILGSVVAVVLAPAFPLSAEIPTAAFLLLPALSIAVAVLGSVGAARRLVSIQPALSFRS